MKIKQCPISGSEKSVEFLNLGEIPLVNNLLPSRKEAIYCPRFPLGVQYFLESKLVTLTEIVNKDKLFLNYVYQSGVNKPYLQHCSEMYDYLAKYVNMRSNPVIVDIGGNDGSLLLEFRKKNPMAEYINIDASESFKKINEDAKITYYNNFFGEDFNFPVAMSLITSTNVLQHSLPAKSFVRGIKRNLDGVNGIWCLEFPYLVTTLLSDNYDQIYHEHVYYFILKNIKDMVEEEGMNIINVSYHTIHAGTLRVLISARSAVFRPDSSLESFLNMEKLITPEYCINWGKRTLMKIILFKKFIKRLLESKKTIIGFGAAAKGCVFLNTVGIDYNIMPYIIDDTPFKQNKYVPGTGIKVVSRDILKTQKVDFILILAHNFKDYIIDSLKGQYSGRYIIMFPEIKII
jgi:hypothetical protein